ncbi:alcohol dehydrogenase [Arthrobacter sp. SW1]|uniref:zinc-dependent alcohol dehydrogenase family protein n=1 Tax=Arthrobacter sp. SW1 TaxID=1920889 RepID=UPI000877E8FA|nr:zinc-dependent alcohol dehydrogenase family protein [Arthrobacter sp. SW1]OFI38166.1 alcohol dehydrogenase [Arthrobacter sp. SW1]
MKAALVTTPGTLEVTEFPDPTPRAGDLILKVAAAGICGTDLHILHGGFAKALPLVPGHEFAGEIVAVGADVTGFRVGDRVTADPNMPCRSCPSCRVGRGNLCDDFQALGVSEAGAMAEYVRVPAALAVKLPGHVATEDAALIEPLSCAIHAFDVLRMNVGAHVLIYGAGTMGLMLLQLAKQAGAASVHLVDVNPERLATVWLLGATGAAATAEEFDRPQGWDVVIDATGNPRAIADALSRVAKGGTYLQFGVPPEDARVEFDPFRVYKEEIRILGSMAVLHSFERAADLFATGLILPDIFISHRFSLEQAPEAMALFASGQGRKVLIRPGA